MTTTVSNIYLKSSHAWRFVVFMVFLVVGPSLALLQLKGFHLSVFFLALVGFLYLIKTKSLDIKQAQLCMVYSVFIGSWFVVHAYLGVISTRYITYLFYFTFTLAVFYFSFRALITLEKETLFKIIQTFIYVDLFIVMLEVIANQAIFNFYPLVGSEYQVGSAFWSNMNTNATALILFNTSLYFLNFKRAFYVNTIPLMVLSLVVDAKLCFIAATAQIVLTQMLASGLARVIFITSLAVVIPIIVIVFQQQLNYVIYTFYQALDFLSNTEALEAIVSSGNMFSVAIRAFALSEMLNLVSEFSILNWVFGIGFGNINISFVNNEWGGLIEYFAPHLFYLEMTIYAGINYYIFYFLVMKIIGGRLAWRSMLIACPTLGSVIAISSAVYFLPLYFFLAVLVYWEYQQLNKETLNAK
ncbi:hypothetical protein HII17_15490 [Thalassotalea sp. M1531]|uniref:O-antigen polymerase n=1 Tax=Thalassotalea algicola TaxID=2716224 RepID=A0A7Y0Q885_9GAMM|nr:hypothetical protein [Thalassotalea algicola]NMP32961.1 hypothetical protein [Thalassotalea algicola]